MTRRLIATGEWTSQSRNPAKGVALIQSREGLEPTPSQV